MWLGELIECGFGLVPCCAVGVESGGLLEVIAGCITVVGLLFDDACMIVNEGGIGLDVAGAFEQIRDDGTGFGVASVSGKGFGVDCLGAFVGHTNTEKVDARRSDDFSRYLTQF